MHSNNRLTIAIDCGNTRCKAGIFKEGELLSVESFENGKWEELLLFTKRQSPVAVILSSVVDMPPDFIRPLGSSTETFIQLDKSTPLPVTNSYKSPETLGKDRVAAICGAWAESKGKHILTIDAGTCITYDFLKDGNEYTGGAISPGLHMRFNALHHFTGKLPQLMPEEISFITGANTRQSILSGVVNGITFEIDSFINSYKNKYGKIDVFLTGGDANFLAKNLKNSIFAVPNLVLKGLNQILTYNVKKN